jgi:hypothetical protein
VVTEADPGLLRVRERDTAAWAIGRAPRPQAVVAAAVVGAAVVGRILGFLAQRGEHQDRDAPEAEDVYSGDHHQHQLRSA